MYEKTINISPQRIPSLTDIEYKPRSLQPTTVEQIISRKKRFNAHVSQAAKRCRELHSVAEKPSKPLLVYSPSQKAIDEAYVASFKKKMGNKKRAEYEANKIQELKEEIELKKEELFNLQKFSQKTAPSMMQIAVEVSEKYSNIGVSYNDLFGVRKNMKAIVARYEAYYRCHCETTNSLPAIGRYFGGKHHTTVWHGIRRYEELQKDPSVKKWLPEHLILPVNYLELAGEK